MPRVIKPEAEQRPEQNPKVNPPGVEELIADRSYPSGAVLERMKGYEVRTYIPERNKKGGGTGRAKASSSRWCSRIESECGPVRQESTAAAGRVCRAQLRPLLRDGRDAAVPSARTQNILQRQLIHGVRSI